MGSIIISMPKQEDAVKIKRIIQSGGYWDEVIICRQGSDILELINEQDVRLVICMRKLRDMGYEELMSFLPASVEVILLTKDEALLPFSSNVTKLLMPFRGEALISLIKKLLVSEGRVKKKKFRTPEEQALIDKAKQFLMENRDMTEPEAFRYLQKTSMDTQRSFVETAKMILVWKE